MDKKNAALPGSACVHMFLYGLAPAAPGCAEKIRTINTGKPPDFSRLGFAAATNKTIPIVQFRRQ